MSQKKVSKTYLSLYILAFVGVTIVFMLVGFVMIHTFSDYVRDEMVRNATYTAKSYSHTLEKNIQAYEAVTELMEDKIEAAGNGVINAQYPERLNLAVVAEKLNVDSIDVYNRAGVVVSSAYPENVGWRVYEGHPVYDFYVSDLTSFIGPVRTNTISNLEYKYGYYRMDNGGFVQIGVSADHIKSFVDNFEMINNFNMIRNGNSLLHLTFIDNDYHVLASTESDRIGEIVQDPAVIESVEAGKESGAYATIGEEEVYQVFVPVYHENGRQGTLAVAQSVKETETLLNRLTGVSLVILFFVYGALLFLFNSSYRRFRNLMNLAYFDQSTKLPNEEYLRTILTEEKNLGDHTKKALILVRHIHYKTRQFENPYESTAQIVGRIGRTIPGLVNYPVQVFNLSEDKFILLAEEYKSKLELISLVEEVTNLSREHFNLHGTIEYMNIKFGITEMDENGKSMEQLLKEASVSLSSIGEKDEVNYAFFSYHTGRKLQMEDMIVNELKEIISDESSGGVHLLYQPIISMRDGSVSSFEALARFTSKKYGEVPPEKFIEIAEKNNLMIPLGNLIFAQASRYAKKMFEKGYSHVRVSVNISAIQLLHEDFLKDILQISEHEGISGEHIILEIEESVLIDNFKEMNKKLQEIRDHGFKIALDNFGTSYSSLRSLKELNVDILKIDKAFIDPISPGDTSEYITRDIISLAHRLGLNVVAEGVELESQMEYLFYADCDCVQGYICGRPAKPEEASLTLIASPNNCWVRVMRRKFPIITSEDSGSDEVDGEPVY
ncbi:EAL domain-containing protein [Proteiniclasticum sp. C24MP]|uniref:EAL domain-containing protein n=1 Tax=Proteiniclasticum sp. C24MP TaxID=3374101 RepID=UPI0037549B63